VAAQHIQEHLEEWQSIALAITALNTKTSEVGLIAHQLAQLISLLLLVAHNHLVCTYDDSFFQPHFDYLKKKDLVSNLNSFDARNMPLYSYIMHRGLVYLSEHWNDMAQFKTFVGVFATIPFAIAGEPLLATRIAYWFINKSAPPLPAVHLPLLEHRTKIDVKSMMEFFTADKNIEQYNHRGIFQTFVTSNTQLCERWIKDANERLVTCRSERLVQPVAICRLMTVMEYYCVANRVYEQKEQKANNFYSSGKAGSRIDKDNGEVKEWKNSRLPEGKLIIQSMLDGIKEKRN